MNKEDPQQREMRTIVRTEKLCKLSVWCKVLLSMLAGLCIFQYLHAADVKCPHFARHSCSKFPCGFHDLPTTKDYFDTIVDCAYAARQLDGLSVFSSSSATPSSIRIASSSCRTSSISYKALARKLL